MPQWKIHTVTPGGVESLTAGTLHNGYYSVLDHTVVVDQASTNTEFAIVVSHELLHAAGYKAAQISGDRLLPYRSGVSIYDKEGITEYFGALEEAIVAELTYRIYEQELRKHPACKEEILATETIKGWLRDASDSDERNDKMSDELEAWLGEIYIIRGAVDIWRTLESYHDDESRYEYLQRLFGSRLERLASAAREGLEERRKLNMLLDQIVTNITEARGKAPDREELFHEFARAHFTGNILPVARIIEGVFGKGSFRRLASELGNTVHS